MILKGAKWALKKLKVLEVNGCTMAPDFNFKSCCDEHDVLYHFRAPRSYADRRLRECICERRGIVIAYVYWCAVRLFGWIFYYRRDVAAIWKRLTNRV